MMSTIDSGHYQVGSNSVRAAKPDGYGTVGYFTTISLKKSIVGCPSDAGECHITRFSTVILERPKDEGSGLLFDGKYWNSR